MSASEPVSKPARRRIALRDNPWWIPAFLGTVPDIEPRLVTLLGIVSLAVFFEQYDLSMITSALKFIAEDLHLREESLGGNLGLIRLGALPAFFIVPFADRIGRRRIFLDSMLGMSVATFATAFSQTAGQFVALQMISRTFMITCSAVAIVILTEEYPAQHRGWGIGMLGALAACGHGLGAALFAAIRVLPYGWRSLYAIGVVPLLLLPMFRRNVAETVRFSRRSGERGAEAGGYATQWLKPLAAFARTYPRRVIGVGAAAALEAAGAICVFQFTGYFTIKVHGWSPGQFSAMVILGGGVGIIGNVVAGRLGDRVGRRVVGFAFLATFPLLAATFYNGPEWAIPIAFAGIVFCSTAGTVILRALSAELFPTLQRGTASGFVSLLETIGAAVGLALLGLGTSEPGAIPRMTTLISGCVLLSGASLFFLPETQGQELEAISRDD